jgi:transcriptional regulator with GAF, ATPase, and Fis domain
MLASPVLDWPGNVRQLESVLQRAVERAVAAGTSDGTLSSGHLTPSDLGHHDLPATTGPAQPPRPANTNAPRAEDLLQSWQQIRTQRSALDEAERRVIAGALTRSNGVVAHAARELGTSRTGLLSRMQTLGVSRVKATTERETDDGGDGSNAF